MATSNFNVQNFDQLVSNAMSFAERVVSGMQNITKDCVESSGLYASEDSSVSGAYGNVGNAIASASNKFSDLMNNLVQLLMEYRAKTLENENATASAVAAVNGTLEGAMAAIAALGGK